MLTLNDGRNELWQWDTGRNLTVDADCSQVHFSNKVFGRSIDVDVTDGVAIIPDILLQTDKDLNVWAFVGTAENGYTKISKIFKVNRRNKPADYVFTPIEQMTIDEIAAIAQSVRDDADAGMFNGKDGYTPVKGIDYFTDEDKTEIAEMAAELVEVPDSGGNADYSFLSGLKYNALGDSIVSMQGALASPITFGSVGYTKDLQNRDISTLTVEGYVTAIERRYGLIASNFGAAGHTLVADYGTLVAKDYSDVALVTIAYGVNDARTGVPLGTVNSTDITTFAGALNKLLQKIYTDNPECRVLVLAPLQRLTVTDFGIATPNANGNYLIDFVNMCKAIAEKRSTAFLDQYRCSGINQTNLYYYTVEGVHPVNQGFARIRNAVIGILDELFALEFEPIGTMTNTGDIEPEEPDTGGDTGGSEGDDTPEEDTGATTVDLSGMFTQNGKDQDGWGIGGNLAGWKHAHFTDILPSKTYTYITYTGSEPTSDLERNRLAMTWTIFNEDGSVKTGNYMTSCQDISGFTAAVDGTETINGTEYVRMKTVFTTNASLRDGLTFNLNCLEACVDYASLSYI